MAKMFYSIEEAAQKLDMSEDQVRGLVESGQLQEFRDRDRLMFKREQVDLLAGGDEEDTEDIIPLADGGDESALGLSLEDSGPAVDIERDQAAKEASGISIFDADDVDTADPMAATQITDGGELTMEAVGGSGSGLLDLTREGDDTSLGADLLEDVYGDEEGGFDPSAADTQGSSGLFETTSAASDVSGAGGGAVVVAAVEPYEGPASGWTGGLALGSVLVLAVGVIIVILAMVGGSPAAFMAMVSPDPLIWAGIFAGILVLMGIVGWLLGRSTS